MSKYSIKKSLTQIKFYVEVLTIQQASVTTED